MVSRVRERSLLQLSLTQAVKPSEIVTDALEMREVCRVRDRLVVSGYSVIRDVTGRGSAGCSPAMI